MHKNKTIAAKSPTIADPVLFCGLAALHGVLLIAWPSAILLGVLLWWNANTISHNFIHRAFFKRRWQRRTFAAYLSLLLGFPHQLWKERHLAHHANRRYRLRWSYVLFFESVGVFSLWISVALAWPGFFLSCYLPGFVLGQLLCFLQGHYEHARGATSHYGWLYNLLFFNDGHHVEHHAHPARAWQHLPALRGMNNVSSCWPAVLRFLDGKFLNACEYSLFRLPALRRFVLWRHEQAIRWHFPKLAGARRIGIVGGGIFPRTALILSKLLPSAQLVIIDGNAKGNAMARPFLDPSVQFRSAWFDPREHNGFDLLVVPLALMGERSEFYARPPAPLVLVHDWLWRARGESRIVSTLLLKRLNLIQQAPCSEAKDPAERYRCN